MLLLGSGLGQNNIFSKTGVDFLKQLGNGSSHMKPTTLDHLPLIAQVITFSSKYKVLAESLGYTWEMFLAEVGGYVGLLLGISVFNVNRLLRFLLSFSTI